MPLPHRVTPGRLLCLLLASTLLGACATGPRSFGPSRGTDLRLDTETASHLRHAATAGSATASPYAAALRAALTFARSAPALITLLKSAEEVSELELQLRYCVELAEQHVNASFFGNRPPTREECRMEMEGDECGQSVTMAMFLGRKKHELALEYARQVLAELWPAPFSIEQRYRIYQDPRLTETISSEKERHLIETAQAYKLRGTIKPDLVLHASRRGEDLLRSLPTLDFKFPCPQTNQPQWTVYSNPSACGATTQQEAYEHGLGGPALMISPKGVPD